MTTTASSRTTEFRRIAKQFDDRMRQARSSELARDGRLLEAEGLLCQGGQLPESVEELDLLARIHVRQGRYDDARRRWRDASGLNGDPSHSQCIEALDQWLDYRRRMKNWRIKVACVVATSVAAIGTLLHFHSCSPP